MDGRKESLHGGIGEVLRLSLPLVAAAILTTLNGLTDNFFLARHSDVALRAALPANTIVGFLTALVLVFLKYSGTLLAQAHGGGRRAHALAIAANAGWLILFSVPLFLASLPLARTVLALFGHEPALLAQECSLVRILLAGAPFLALATVAAGFFTGQGLTRTVGVVTALGVTAKILLTPVLVFGCGPIPSLGIAGAGLSGVLSDILLCLAYAFAARRNPLVALAAHRPGLLSPKPGIIRRILAAGFPLCGCIVIGHSGFFALTALIGRLDAPSAAASSAVFAINCPFNAIAIGLARGVEALTGRFFGKGDLVAVRRTVFSSALVALVLSAAYIGLLLGCGRFLLGLFLSDDTPFDRAVYYAAGESVILMLVLRIGIEFLMSILQSTLRGIGNTKAVFLATMASTVLVWIPGLTLVTLFHPTVAAYWSLMIVSSLVLGAVNLRSLASSSAGQPPPAAAPR